MVHNWRRRPWAAQHPQLFEQKPVLPNDRRPWAAQHPQLFEQKPVLPNDRRPWAAHR